MLKDSEISAVIEEVWTTVLDLSIKGRENIRPVPRDHYTASVSLTGQWSGVVMCQYSSPLGRKVAGAMFQMPADEIQDDDITDALGEIANIVAGNIKALLPSLQHCELAIPNVVSGFDHEVHCPKAEIVFEAAFECDGEPFIFQLLKENQGTAGGTKT